MLPPKSPQSIVHRLREALRIVKVPDNQSLLRCIDCSLSEQELRMIEQFFNLALDITKFPIYAENSDDQEEMGMYNSVVDDDDKRAVSCEGVRKMPYLTLEDDEAPSNPYYATEEKYSSSARLPEGILLTTNEQEFGELHTLPHLKYFDYCSGEEKKA